MTKLEKMLKMDVNLLFNRFLVSNPGSDNEYYIDPRTIRNGQGMYIVKPIAEKDLFFWYICPVCQQIHIESKRCLNVNNKILYANCIYRHALFQYIMIDCKFDPVSFQEVPDCILEDEWIFMKKFEGGMGG